jgi:hypothetical protein
MMKVWHIMVTLLCMAPLAGACSSNARIQSGAPNINGAIRIGSGGGFSGIFSGYLFNGNGNVYRWKVGPGEFEDTELLFTEQDSVQQFFTILDDAGFATCAFDHPGNMTEFVELRRNDSIHTVCWGKPGLAPPQRIAEVQRSMLEFARRRGSDAQ